MRIVDFNDLPQSMEGSVQLLDMTAGWAPMGFRVVKEIRGLGYPSADYFGLCAVEKGELCRWFAFYDSPSPPLKGERPSRPFRE